jgi:hypothetical protein
VHPGSAGGPIFHRKDGSLVGIVKRVVSGGANPIYYGVGSDFIAVYLRRELPERGIVFSPSTPDEREAFSKLQEEEARAKLKEQAARTTPQIVCYQYRVDVAGTVSTGINESEVAGVNPGD